MKTKRSPRGKLVKDDLVKICKGAVIAAMGVVAAAATQYGVSDDVDVADIAWLAVAAMFATAANGIRKLLADNTTESE